MKWLKVKNCNINMDTANEIIINDYGISIITKHYHNYFHVESNPKHRTESTCLTPQEFINLKGTLEYIIDQDNQCEKK